MTTLRLHAACPACRTVQPLRPDGTMLLHTRWVGEISPHRGRCEGTGQPPPYGAIDAWLDAEIAGASRVIDTAIPEQRAEEVARHAKELASLDAREARMRERLAWATAKRAQRGGGTP